jgi:hypothetical protein
MAVNAIGKVIPIASQDVRVLMFNWRTAAYRDTYLGMVDGWKARIMSRYLRWFERTKLIRRIGRWDAKRLGVKEGEQFPKWSLIWFLCSPQRWLNENGIEINEQEFWKYE